MLKYCRKVFDQKFQNGESQLVADILEGLKTSVKLDSVEFHAELARAVRVRKFDAWDMALLANMGDECANDPGLFGMADEAVDLCLFLARLGQAMDH
ncbi:MAG: hypothetical protein JWR25_818 [Noviherbaspirillum sp.]|nr:hypothetical protein [Noviherbaspirillum sp.]